MSRSARFWDRFALRYSKMPIADEATYHKKLEVTREYLQPDMKVLEFGCGTGGTAVAHARSVGHIRAIDVSPKMIEIACGKAEADGVANVEFEVASIDDLSVSDQSLDAVLGLNILHLLDDWEDVIVRVHRMLRPGGIFITSTICLRESMRLLGLIAPIGSFLGLMPRLKSFSSRELEGHLTAVGFEIEHQWQPGQNKALFIVARRSE